MLWYNLKITFFPPGLFSWYPFKKLLIEYIGYISVNQIALLLGVEQLEKRYVIVK